MTSYVGENKCSDHMIRRPKPYYDAGFPYILQVGNFDVDYTVWCKHIIALRLP